MADEYYMPEAFQDLILACMIRHPEQFIVVGQIIKPEYFWGLNAMRVCKAVQDFCVEHGHWPTFPALEDYLLQQFPRDEQDKASEAVAYMRKLEELDTRDAEYARSRAVHFARERALINAIRESAAHIKSGEWPAQGFAPLFQEAMAVGDDVSQVGLNMYQDAEAVIDTLTNKDYGVKTGFPVLDDIWFTGWCPGWLVILLAPPKGWKSTLSVNLALSMVSQEGGRTPSTVFYYACELSAELVLARAYTALTGKTMEEMYTATSQFKAETRRALNTRIGGNLIAKFFPSKTATIADIKAHAKMVMNTMRNEQTQLPIKPDVIIIDHAETIKTDSEKGTSDWRQQADIYTSARAMAEELRCVVIMPDRCNRETVEAATPSLTSFQGSMEKAGVVDVGIGICQSPDERKINKVRYFVFLNRHGEQYIHMAGTITPKTLRMTVDQVIPWSEAEPDGKTKSKDPDSMGLIKLRSEDAPDQPALEASNVQPTHHPRAEKSGLKAPTRRLAT